MMGDPSSQRKDGSRPRPSVLPRVNGADCAQPLRLNTAVAAKQNMLSLNWTTGGLFGKTLRPFKQC